MFGSPRSNTLTRDDNSSTCPTQPTKNSTHISTTTANINLEPALPLGASGSIFVVIVPGKVM
jgi:hypothetical protein